MLNLDKMREIFKINLDRLRKIEERRSQIASESTLIVFEQEILNYATVHFQTYGTGLGSWNGRQIRNAFQIASSMARYDGTKVPGAQAQLRASHFEKVAAATYSYDLYRKQTLKKGDTDLAKSWGHRDDNYGTSAQHPAPENISLHGQSFGISPGTTPSQAYGQPLNRPASRNLAPYIPGQGTPGYPEYLPQTPTRPAPVSAERPLVSHPSLAHDNYGGSPSYQN